MPMLKVYILVCKLHILVFKICILVCKLLTHHVSEPKEVFRVFSDLLHNITAVVMCYLQLYFAFLQDLLAKLLWCAFHYKLHPLGGKLAGLPSLNKSHIALFSTVQNFMLLTESAHLFDKWLLLYQSRCT